MYFLFDCKSLPIPQKRARMGVCVRVCVRAHRGVCISTYRIARICRYHEGALYVIDVSQSVEHDHPHATAFLRKDCTNVTDFFRRCEGPPLEGSTVSTVEQCLSSAVSLFS